MNITDEEKEQILESSISLSKSDRPFLDMVLQSLDCSENDYLALLALCLLFALANNKGNFSFLQRSGTRFLKCFSLMYC